MNGPLPANLKFRENTDCTHMIRQSLNKWPLMWDSGHGCLSTRAMYSSDICQTGGCFPVKRAGLLKFPSARNKKPGEFPEVTNDPESYAKNWCLLITKIPNVTTFRNQNPTNGESSDKKNLKGLVVRAVWFILLKLPIMLPYSLLHSRFCYRHATLLPPFQSPPPALFNLNILGGLLAFFPWKGGLIREGKFIWKGGGA